MESLFNANLTTEERLLELTGLAFSGHNLSSWCYSPRTGHLFFSSSLYEEELNAFFSKGGCMKYAFETAVSYQHPFIMSDIYGLVWLGEYFTLNAGSSMLMMLGPVFYTNTSGNHTRLVLEHIMMEHTLTSEQYWKYHAILKSVPVVSPQTIVAYARMLHFIIAGKPLDTSAIHYQASEPLVSAESEENDAHIWLNYEHTNGQNQLFLQCVREGNTNYKQILNGLNYSVMEFESSKDPRQTEHNKLVIAAALCSQAAIEGGLSPKVALAMQNSYIIKADKLRTITELRRLNSDMVEDFISHVHQQKTHTDVSKHIQECCEYIRSNLTHDLSIQKIAKEIGYTEYYLTRKFQKEMGIRLLDYIRNARIEYAKVCLVSTNKSIQEISDMLQFSSRNHFTKVFRDITGIPPSEYRSKHGGNE